MAHPRINRYIEKSKTELAQEIEHSIRETQLLVRIKRYYDRLSEKIKLFSEKKTTVVNYKIGSLFLKECADYVTSSSYEVMHLVSGIELERNFYIMDRLEKIKFQASAIGARADMKDLSIKLTEMDEYYGHLLLGVFHSHPFGGVAGTQPSWVDKHLQSTFESSGYFAIQAVFSRDGHIRFFSNNLKFEIEVYGKGLEKIDGGKDNEAIYRLVDFREAEEQNIPDKKTTHRSFRITSF